MKVCAKCKDNMHKANAYTSGNARFEIWQCNSCEEQIKVCVGFI